MHHSRRSQPWRPLPLLGLVLAVVLSGCVPDQPSPSPSTSAGGPDPVVSLRAVRTLPEVHVPG
jgi:hypothetical protein